MSSRGYSNRGGDAFQYLNDDLTVVDHGGYILKEALEDKKLPRGAILQIQQVVNVSAPKLEKKFYDPANHILKITLTDGKTTCYGLITDLDKSSGISINSPPGSKIKVVEEIRNIYGSWIHLDKFNVTFIGGRVGSLIDKWLLQKKLEEKHEWGSMGHVEGSEGPPQWKPFGQKLDNTDVALLRKMKAMDIVNEKKDVTENDQSEFAAQRSEAISELMDKSTKQNWQKPKKTLIDKDIQDIMNEGFSMDQASEAMARFKNPQKALKFLKGRSGQSNIEDRSSRLEERKDRRKKPLDPDAEEDAPIPKEFQRPTKSISLFGFIQGHIKDEETSEPVSEQQPSYYDEQQSNFPDRGGRGGRRGFRGGGGGNFSRGRGGRGGYQGDQDRSDRYDRNEQPNRDSGNRGGRYPGGNSYRNDDSRGSYSNRGSAAPSFRGRDNYQSYQPPQRSYNENMLNNVSEYPPVGSQGPPRFESFSRGGSGGSNRGYGGESHRSYSRGDHHGAYSQSSVPYGGPQGNQTYPGRPQTGRGSRTYQFNTRQN